MSATRRVGVTPGPAARRWRRLVRARLAEMERLREDGGAVGAAFWDRRARAYAARTRGSERRDPVLARVRRSVGPRTTVLDVGAGPGRLALPLAARAGEVVAVDASEGMLRVLAREARRRGISNVRPVHGRWEEVDVPAADVALCVHVLPLVEDVAPFLAKIDRTARRRVFVGMTALGLGFLMDPLWRHFHGRPRLPGPTFLDAAAVLAELGVGADVEVVEAPTLARYRNLRHAVEAYRDQLLLPDTHEVRAELRGILAGWLVRRDGGLGEPMATVPTAVISWSPSEPPG